MSVADFVMNLLQKKYSINQTEDMESFNYVESGYIDSMGIVQFIVALEDEFSIEFTDEDLNTPEFKTIGGVIQIIEEKQKGTKC